MFNINNYQGSLKSIDEAILTNFEDQLGYKLPDDYRSFLLTVNGGIPALDTFYYTDPASRDKSIRKENINHFYGIGISNDIYRVNSIQDVLNIYHRRVPSTLLPIGENYINDLICISLDYEVKGRVYLWQHSYEADEEEYPSYHNLILVSESFADLISMLSNHTDTGDITSS
jgi:hypothetical protein